VGRDPRYFDAREIYHVTQHAVDGLHPFDDEVECQDFVVRLGRACTGWHVYAACVMGTHYHLVFQPRNGDVSDAMRVLHGGFARAFNKRRQRRGAVWEARFTATLIADEPHLQEAIRYVARNPVRAGIVNRPEDWPWSTYGQVVGTQPRWPFFDPLRVIERFGGLAATRSYVESARNRV
jgi:REP element-mobilizing transposase RayT